MRDIGRVSTIAFALMACLQGACMAHAPAREAAKDKREEFHSRYREACRLLNAKETHDQGAAALEGLIIELRQQAEQEPKAAWPHHLIGEAAIHIRQPEAARKELDTAAQLAPDDAEIVFHQADAHYLAGDVNGAIPLIERAITLAPQDPLPQELLGSVLMEEKHPDQALPHLEKACALPGASPYGFNLLASAQRAVGKYDEALVNSEKAAEMEPDEAEPHFYAGTEYQLKGQAARALPHFETLSKLDAGNPMVWSKLVQVYQSLGDTAHRDAARAKVIELSSGGKRNEFGREMFAVGDLWVFASEAIEPKPPFNALYAFTVLPNSRSDQPLVIFTLESADFDQAFAREQGMPADQRVYTLDSLVPGKSHATHEYFHRKPTYEEVRNLVVAVLKGENQPMSSTTIETTEEEPAPEKPAPEKPAKKTPEKPAKKR